MDIIPNRAAMQANQIAKEANEIAAMQVKQMRSTVIFSGIAAAASLIAALASLLAWLG